MNAVVQLQPQGGALAAHTPGHRAVDEIIEHVATVQRVMQAVMKGPSKENPHGVHYGVIPGTDKPTLLKAGAELLCMTFRIADKYVVEDLSTGDTVRYRVTCIGEHQVTGTVLGTGMGEASSGEEKYKWIKASRREWEATPETQRRIKYGWNKQERKEYEILQVRTEPANLANTVLKMANKRAKLAMVLNVTAASDMFTQDLEDMEDRLREHLADGDGDDTGTGEPQKKPFPDESFAASMPAFQKAINKGKTPADVLATFEQFNPEFALSQVQRDAIFALKAAGAAKDTGNVTDATPKVTYAVLSDRLNKAADRDAALLVLDEGRALAPDQQADLQKLFDQRFPQA
jgi:hypothetical protein